MIAHAWKYAGDLSLARGTADYREPTDAEKAMRSEPRTVIPVSDLRQRRSETTTVLMLSFVSWHRRIPGRGETFRVSAALSAPEWPAGFPTGRPPTKPQLTTGMRSRLPEIWVFRAPVWRKPRPGLSSRARHY